MANAAASNKSVFITDGSADFAGGVDSNVVPTIQTNLNPGGLGRNQLAWLINGTVRDGGITQRSSWAELVRVHNGSSAFQGGYIYEPDNDYPYLMTLIGGNLYKVLLNSPYTVTNLSTVFGLTMPVNQPIAYFVQAEQFLIIQAGDYVTLPLFWDGTTLRRSNGITTTTVVTGLTELDTVHPTNFLVPIQGQTTTLTLNIVPPPPADNNTIRLLATVGGLSYGDYQIVSHAGSVLTLKKLDFNAQPFSTNLEYKVYRVDQATNTNGNEIPAAGPMDYYQARVWYAMGRQFSAGDIVGGAAGTKVYNFRDSVLKVTENPIAIGGDGFAVPSNAGNIRALSHAANMDTALGQSPLYIFTRKSIFSLEVPVSRNDWIAANSNNQPVMKVVQRTNGSVNDRSVVPVNGDLFFQALEPSIRSLVTAVRYFQQWGNTPISNNENRLLQFNNRALLDYASGISFDNRLLQTALPRQTAQGVVHDALAPLDFDPVSSFGRSDNPVWEGMYSGIPILQLYSGDFGGLERAFALMVSAEDSSIRLWEISKQGQFENGDNRVRWQIEWPAFNWGKEFVLKKLVSAELWIDRLYGEVVFKMEYRPDSDPCWYPWHEWKFCSARNSCEDPFNPVCYPLTTFSESYRSTATLPLPPDACESISGRPANVGYQFQTRLTITGFCRVRGILLHAEPMDRSLYEGLVC